MARDLQLHYKHGVRIERATEDLDFGVAVKDWKHYEAIRECLVRSPGVRQANENPHTFWFPNRIRLDIIPFGGVQDDSHFVPWPPDGNPRMNVLGFSALEKSSDEFLLPKSESVSVASLPMLLVLKFFAWQDRSLIRPGVDAADLFLILSTYTELAADELYGRFDDLLANPEFEHELAGAKIAARHVIEVLRDADPKQEHVLENLTALLRRQLDLDSPGLLIEQAPAGRASIFGNLLEEFCVELEARN
jgi:predicted nucleotidyltransferase